MDNIFYDENNKFQIDLSAAQKPLGNLHSKFKSIGNIISDVDWIAETDDEVILIEFKNYEEKEHIPEGNEVGSTYQKYARKYYGSVFYYLSCGNQKPFDYVVVLESPHMDNVVRNWYRNSIMKLLPFKLQEMSEIAIPLIRNFQVMSVSEWNKLYPQYPIRKKSINQ